MITCQRSQMWRCLRSLNAACLYYCVLKSYQSYTFYTIPNYCSLSMIDNMIKLWIWLQVFFCLPGARLLNVHDTKGFQWHLTFKFNNTFTHSVGVNVFIYLHDSNNRVWPAMFWPFVREGVTFKSELLPLQSVRFDNTTLILPRSIKGLIQKGCFDCITICTSRSQEDARTHISVPCEELKEIYAMNLE